MILRKQRVTIIYQHHFIISVSNTEKKKFVVVFICLPIVSITMKELWFMDTSVGLTCVSH